MIRYLFLLLFLSAGNYLSAQQSAAMPPLLEVRYLKDSMKVEENNFAFNNMSLMNKSGSVLHARVIFSAPEFIDIISDPIQDIELQPGINQSLPLRFTIASSQVPVDWYPVVAEIRLRETDHLIRAVFMVKPIESVQFRTSLQLPVVNVLETDKDFPVGIFIANTGNKKDSYQITIQPGNQLNFQAKSYSLELVPGESRTVTPHIILSPKDILYLQKDELTIFIKNSSGEQKMLVQQVQRVGSQYTGNKENWTKMPLTVGVNLQNIAGRSPFVSFNAQGSMTLRNNAQLSLLLQTDNYYSHFTGNTHLATIKYNKGPWMITAGSILDFNHFLIDGMGADLRFLNSKDQLYEVMAVKSRIGDTKQFNFKTTQPLGKKLSVSNNTFLNQDDIAKQTAALTTNQIDWLINKRTKLTLEGGAGLEKTSREKLDTTLYGTEAGYRFENSGQHYLLNSAVTWYSKNFPGFNKGFFYQLHEARVLWNNFFAGPFYEVNKRSYNNTKDSLLNYLFNNNNQERGIRFGYFNQQLSAVLTGSRFNQVQDSANAPLASMNKLSLNATWRINKQWNLSILSTAGSIHMSGINAGNIPSFTNFISLQSGKYGLQFRFDKGPYYYYEIKQYLQQPQNWQRIQIAPFVEIPLEKQNLHIRLQANYLQEQQNNNHYLIGYTNVQYNLPRAGLDIALTAQANFSRKEDPFVSLSIRKRLQLPIARNRNIRSFHLLFFYDKNQNGNMDEGEVAIADARFKLNNMPLIADEKGMISVNNTTEENFQLDCSEAVTDPGWVPAQGFRQTIKASSTDRTILIPYIRSKVLKGKILLVKDPNSSTTMQLSGIRITALSSNGEEFKTLTNDEGVFLFSLPDGNYIISVNTAAFDDQYKVTEPRKPADLKNNDMLNINFEVRQNKRQINIRRG